MEKKIYLSKIMGRKEYEVVHKYTKGMIRHPLVQVCELAHDRQIRNENEWLYVALKLVDDISQGDLISFITKLGADEYIGLVDGFHVFWFD